MDCQNHSQMTFAFSEPNSDQVIIITPKFTALHYVEGFPEIVLKSDAFCYYIAFRYDKS